MGPNDFYAANDKRKEPFRPADNDSAEKRMERLERDRDALLEALKACAIWFESHRPLEANKKSDAARNALNNARAAIAQAEA